MIWKQAGSWHTIWSAKLFTKMLKFNSGCDVKIHHKAETQDKNPWQDFLHPMLQLFGVFTVWVWSFNRWAFLNSFGKKIHNSQRSWVDLTLFDIIYITKSFSQYFALKTFWVLSTYMWKITGYVVTVLLLEKLLVYLLFFWALSFRRSNLASFRNVDLTASIKLNWEMLTAPFNVKFIANVSYHWYGKNWVFSFGTKGCQ